jgi:hypothetical protein
MSGHSIGDILSFLEEDTEKTASAAPEAQYQGYADAAYENEAFEKIAEKLETEQFEKMAQDAWVMGEIMAEAFHDRLTKIAVAMGDDREAGEIMQSGQGDPPMAAQRAEDVKDRVNVAAPVLEAAVNQAVTSKVPPPVGPPTEVAPGAAPIMQPPPPPDLQETDQMAPKTSSDELAAAELLYHFLRNR